MRQVRFSKPLPAGDEAKLLAFWASLSSSSPLLNAPALHQHLVNDQARFAISLARQYQSPAVGAESLLATAHSALVDFMNRTGNQREIIGWHFAHVLREAMIQLASAGK